MKKNIIISVAIITCVFASNVRAGVILQDQFNFGWELRNNSAGQVFVAENEKIASIGFNIEKILDGGFPDLWIELFEGEGDGGLSLGVSQIAGIDPADPCSFFPNIFGGFVDGDFSSVTLSVGETYTAVLIADDNSFWGVRSLRWFSLGLDDPYTNGDAFINGIIPTKEDLAFRVIPIPEPMTLGFLWLGSFIVFRKRKQRIKLR